MGTSEMASTLSLSTTEALLPPDLDIGRLQFISLGISGAVLKVSDEIVIKKPLPLPNCKEQIDVERRIYERLGRHPHITTFLGVHQGMLVLERLQYPLRKRLWDLRGTKLLPSTQDVLRWASQICTALEHVHSLQIFQVDISAGNILLDWDDNAKLSDFAGSSIDGCRPLALPSLRSEHPRWPASNATMQSELFALGSTLYEIETTETPYRDKGDAEVLKSFERDIFPDTESLVLGRTIQKCWQVHYQNASEVIRDLRLIQDGLSVPHSESTSDIV